MDFQEKARLNQLGQKINIMKGLQLSEDEITKSFDKEDLELVEKSMQHKYIRKEGDKYIYEEKKPNLAKLKPEDRKDNPTKEEIEAKRKEIDYKNDHEFDHLSQPMKIKKQPAEKEEVTSLENLKIGSKLSWLGADNKVHESIVTGIDIKAGTVNLKDSEGEEKDVLYKYITQSKEKSLTADIEKSEDLKEQKIAKILAEHKTAGKLTEEEIQKALESDLEKGEGDRGGKVIGHTKSGKPIYDTKFTHKDILTVKDKNHKLYGKKVHVQSVNRATDGGALKQHSYLVSLTPNGNAEAIGENSLGFDKE